MPQLLDLTGRVYERLTVLRRAPSTAYAAVRWVCRCACGAEVVAFTRNLVTGRTRSCGCLRRELSGMRARLGVRGHVFCAWCNARARWMERDEDGDRICPACAAVPGPSAGRAA